MKSPLLLTTSLFLLAAPFAVTAYADFAAAEKAYDQGDYATALREYQADGSASSLNNVGLMYFTGEGVNQDKREAARWFRKAAEAGSLEAQISIAQMVEAGDGVQRDLHEAAKWYRRAADQDDEEAREKLDLIYRETEGVKTRWYRKDAERGMPRAQ